MWRATVPGGLRTLPVKSIWDSTKQPRKIIGHRTSEDALIPVPGFYRFYIQLMCQAFGPLIKETHIIYIKGEMASSSSLNYLCVSPYTTNSTLEKKSGFCALVQALYSALLLLTYVNTCFSYIYM